MKALILGMAGLSAVGTAAYVTGGKKPIDDFVGVVNKSPAEVYAALSTVGPDGVMQIPTGAAAAGAPRVTRKITKENGKSVRLEVLLDDRAFASVEFELEAAEGGGTRLAGEVDLDTAVINEAIRARGGSGLPIGGALAEGLLDRAFAMSMERAVQQINEGNVSLAALSQGQSGFSNPSWGSDGEPSFGGGSGSMAAAPSWSSRTPASARPQVSTRPAVDPNSAARAHVRQQQVVQQPGW